MTDTPEREQLRGRLLALVDEGIHSLEDDALFEEVARLVFAFQYANNPVYRGFCDARGVRPESLRTWVDIPALPADAFKAAPLICGDRSSATTVFRTSGTTRGHGARGEHFFRDTALYKAALLAGAAEHLVPDRAMLRILSLVAPWTEVPDSSLSFMVSEVMEKYGADGSGFFFVDGAVRTDELIDALVLAERDRAPVLIIGTSLGFVHVLEQLQERGRSVPAAPGSRAMDTGGFKGRMREVARSDLYGAIEERLGIPQPWIVNEYGMTEMSSQLYDGVAGHAGPGMGRLYRGPGWTRTIAVNPETLEPLGAGEVGILRHVDLANLDSVMAIQTADLGRVTREGITLVGRLTGAEPRGCSLAMEDLLGTLG